jgi:hypothetical protein
MGEGALAHSASQGYFSQRCVTLCQPERIP